MMRSLWERTVDVMQQHGGRLDEILYVEFSLLSAMNPADKHAMIMSSPNRYKTHIDNLRTCTIDEFAGVARSLPESAKLHVDLRMVSKGWNMTVDNRCNWLFARDIPPPLHGEIQPCFVMR